jgi:uncharacterized protein
MLKILAFSDMHGSDIAMKKLKKKSKKSDLIICAGDISIFSNDLKNILDFFEKIEKPMIIISGNHEDDHELKNTCSKLKNIIFVKDNIYSIGNYHFICSEGNGFSHEDRHFEKVAENMYKKIKNLRKKDREGVFILVTHAPPHKTRLDQIIGGHSGNKAIRRFIYKSRPNLAICGHIHENSRKKDKINKTRLVNPGPYGMILDVF